MSNREKLAGSANPQSRLDPAGFERRPVRPILQPCVLSSFDPAGLTSRDSRIRDAVLSEPIEYYALMQSEAQQLLPTYPMIPRVVRSAVDVGRLVWNRVARGRGIPMRTAIERMARGASQPRLATCTAKRLVSGLRARGSPQIVALASYVPEISSRDESSWRMAADCLRFLGTLARELRRIQFGASWKRPFVVEVVAGSRVDGIFSASTAESPVYVANLSPTKDVLKRFIDRIRQVSKEFPDVTFAVELEPGPLNLINDFGSLKALCRGLDEIKSKGHHGRIGVNLDVAHWTLAGISPDQIQNCPEIFDRIVHAHMADSGRGHFGDVSIGRISAASHFRPWIELLKERAASCREPVFSRYVSVELEACAGIEQVAESVRKLRELLGED